jgi:hypothetical protein
MTSLTNFANRVPSIFGDAGVPAPPVELEPPFLLPKLPNRSNAPTSARSKSTARIGDAVSSVLARVLGVPGVAADFASNISIVSATFRVDPSSRSRVTRVVDVRDVVIDGDPATASLRVVGDVISTESAEMRNSPTPVVVGVLLASSPPFARLIASDVAIRASRAAISRALSSGASGGIVPACR